MLFLWISIACTVAVYLLFRVFGKRDIDMLPAVVINYFVCALFGHMTAETPLKDYVTEIPRNQLLFACFMGFAFAAVFYLMGKTTNQIGVAGSTIVSRMSMVIPTTYSVIWLNEELHVLKIIGIALALAAIYFTVSPGAQSGKEGDKKRPNLLFPILSFFGVGMVDTSLKISQTHFFGNNPDITYVGLIYNTAFIASLILYLISRKPWRKLFGVKNILGGLVLGFVNFYGIVFIYKALSESSMGGSTIFPINSVGTVALSTVMAIILFHEKLTLKKSTGLGLAIGAILLIAWRDIF